MVPLQAQDVTKYQAGHGKHTEGRKLVAIKRTPQNGLFSVSGSVPDFGRPWTPHRWHQVKVNGTPKNWYDASNGLCGRLMASELSAHCFETFFPSWNWKLRKKYFSVERSVMVMFSQANTFNIRMRLTVEVQGEIVEHSPARLLKRSNVEEKSFNFFLPSYYEMGLLSSFCTQWLAGDHLSAS